MHGKKGNLFNRRQKEFSAIEIEIDPKDVVKKIRIGIRML